MKEGTRCGRAKQAKVDRTAARTPSLYHPSSLAIEVRYAES
jgi:hypothetical protein